MKNLLTLVAVLTVMAPCLPTNRRYYAALAATVKPTVSVVCDPHPGPAAAHGMVALLNALRDKRITVEKVDSLAAARASFVVLAGLATGDGPAARSLRKQRLPVPLGPEALLIRRLSGPGRPTWVVAGADDRGLMYAEYDVADRVGWSTAPAAPLGEVRDASEAPAVAERAVTLYTMNRAYWESRFYDEGYWTRYLDTLARNRFNTISIIFGYENGGFMAPCYPYFFDVDGFPEVRMVGLTPAQQVRNLAALNRLTAMAHDRGLKVTIGIWDHIYRGKVQGGGVPGADEAVTRPTPGLVWGMTAENLIPYTKAALSKFLRAVPGIDTIQFRMHEESGLTAREQPVFWREIFAMLRQTAPDISLDLRAKGLPDATIKDALDRGLKVRISTKFWMEQMGLPFHPTHINTQNQKDRRHSYADMLRYPVTYKVHWELWDAGTTRVLLWGDPAWVLRFVESTRIYNSDGFTVGEPLATKMEGQPHDMPPFDLLKAPYRYYRYEFARYWHFFQVFGRLGYNPNTPAEVWHHEFVTRFGAAAPYVERALHRASWVLPRIIASSYPAYSDFPMTTSWAEKQRLHDLPAFAKGEPSDLQQFVSFDEEAQMLIEGGETAKMRPPETSRWFAAMAHDILADVAAAQQHIGTRPNQEFASTMVDVKILANLALYHSRRIPAAVSYRLYERDQDPAALDDAIAYQRSANDAWRQLTLAAGDVYADDLMMGARSRNLCGHWKDELAAMEKETAALEQQRSRAVAGDAKAGPRYQPATADRADIAVTHQPVTAAPATKPLTITAQVHAAAGVKWARLRYRSVNQTLDFQTLPMLPTNAQGAYQAVIPAATINPTWDLMYLIEVMDNRGHGRICPDLAVTTPYFVVHLLR